MDLSAFQTLFKKFKKPLTLLINLHSTKGKLIPYILKIEKNFAIQKIIVKLMLIIIDQYHSWQCVVIIICLLFVQKNMTSQIWFDLIMNLSSYLNEFTFT